MSALITAALIAWAATVLSLPRLRLRADPVEERRIAALLGGRRRLVGAALLFTVLTSLLAQPGGVNPDLATARERHERCTDPRVRFPVCYRWVSTGAWMREELIDGALSAIGVWDGGWTDIKIIALAEPYGDPAAGEPPGVPVPREVDDPREPDPS